MQIITKSTGIAQTFIKTGAASWRTNVKLIRINTKIY